MQNMHGGNIRIQGGEPSKRVRPKGNKVSRTRRKKAASATKLKAKARLTARTPADAGQKSLFQTGGTQILPEKPDFANRIDERRQLKAKNTHFFMIFAPAGYGKTRLLKQIGEDFKQDGWDAILLDCREDARNLANTSQVLSKLESILLVPGHDGNILENLPEKERLNRVAAAIARTHGQVLFLFDHVEYLNEDVFKWIGNNLLAGLKGRPRIQGLRAFFACRYDRALPGGETATKMGIHLRAFPLSNFDEEDLVQVMKTWAPSLNEDEQLQTARALLDLTRGHPRCVTNVFPKLERSGFTLHRDNGRFREDVRRELFETCVRNVVQDEILAKVDTELRTDSLRTVFVLRRVCTTSLGFLRDAPELQGHDLSTSYSCERFIRGPLEKTRLLTPPVNDELWDTDLIVRHFFAEASQLDPVLRPRYLQLQSIAHSLFLGLFKGTGIPEPPRGRLQNRFYIEAIYHWCRVVEVGDISEEEKRQGLKNLTKIWGEFSRPQFRDHVAHMENLIKLLDDEEVDLPLLLGAQIGEGAFDEFKAELIEVANAISKAQRERDEGGVADAQPQ